MTYPVSVRCLYSSDTSVLLIYVCILVTHVLLCHDQAYEQGRMTNRVHHVANIGAALRALEMKKVKLVNINPSDIADGKPSIVLGLCWTIILHFQVRTRSPSRLDLICLYWAV